MVKACLTQEKADIGSEFDWDAAYEIGYNHGILPMLYYGVVQSDIQCPAEMRNALRLETIKSAMLDQNQMREVEGIERSFQAEGIDYLLLKGAVMKQRYLHAEVRTMGDADILIREGQYERIRPILQELGFTEILESDHELIWDKPGRLHLELHKRPIPSYNKDFYAYYGDGWSLAHRTDSSRHEMRDEDEFIYLFTHYAKHYRDGGVGIRQVADLYVYTRTNLTRTPSRGQRKNIKFFWSAAMHCWPFFMRPETAGAFPLASRRPNCAALSGWVLSTIMRKIVCKQ